MLCCILHHSDSKCCVFCIAAIQADRPDGDAEEELAELQEEFTRRIGQADKTIAVLQVRAAALLTLNGCCVQSEARLNSGWVSHP